jgi:predicted nucleic acid-binding protein
VIYVLDACALISYLHNEKGSDIISDLLKKAMDSQIILYMNIVNLVEVHYANIRNLGIEQAVLILEKILAAPIEIISTISNTVFKESSRLKASYKCSIADAIGLATAIELSAHFVSSDHHELEVIEQYENVSIFWLPPHQKSTTTGNRI